MEVWCRRTMILRYLFALYLFDWYLITHAVIIRALSGFPDSSVGKESACNAGEPVSIHGLERSPGEGISYPLQYSWASLVAQLVKNPPAMWETWIRSLGWEDPLEKGKATHSSILAWRIPWTIQSMGSQRVGYNWATFTFTFLTRTSKPLEFTENNWEIAFIKIANNWKSPGFLSSRKVI